MLVFYLLAAAQIFLGIKSLQGGFNYRKYFCQELSKPESGYMPFASILVPCRGVDKGLRKNLDPLIDQNYPDYEIIFVVDDQADEAVPIIGEIVENADNARLVVAGQASDCGQKVHNLRKAVLEVSGRSKAFVFLDSDARPNRDWLKSLIAPLENDQIGCTTGYRWFVQDKGGFFTHLRAVWNASIASALGSNKERNFCWGGSTAIRRDVFENLDVRRRWKGAVSDDFVITSVLHDAGLEIHFVPQCLSPTIEDCDLRELLEFSTRQMKITKVYSPGLWKASLIASALFAITFCGGIALLTIMEGAHFWAVLGCLSAIYFLGFGKAAIRWFTVRSVLVSYRKKLGVQFFPQVLLWPLSSVLFLYNNVRALFSNKIVWRGIEYRLESPSKTTVNKK